MQPNIPASIRSKIGINLYQQPNHPIAIIKDRIFDFFPNLAKVEQSNPLVSIADNFDRLRVPTTHPSRRSSDTFYQDADTCLRTHMTAYLPTLGQTNHAYITAGDVYRKDTIDATHFPVFHQIDAFNIVPNSKEDLRSKLTGLVKHLFGNDIEFAILEDHDHPDVYFPFTINSFEISVKLNDKELEVLGAGTVHPEIMTALDLHGQDAWAFGLGLERLAMVLFDIPDIRLFWSNDERFLSQFKAGEITKFRPFSKYEVCYKDVSFWAPETFNFTDFCSLIRDQDTHSLIEDVSLIDEFEKQGRQSKCYRLSYRSMERTLLNSEIDEVQFRIRGKLPELGLELR